MKGGEGRGVVRLTPPSEKTILKNPSLIRFKYSFIPFLRAPKNVLLIPYNQIAISRKFTCFNLLSLVLQLTPEERGWCAFDNFLLIFVIVFFRDFFRVISKSTKDLFNDILKSLFSVVS